MTNDEKTLVLANMDKVLRNNHAKRAGLGDGLERVFFAGAGVSGKRGGDGIIYMESIYSYLFFALLSLITRWVCVSVCVCGPNHHHHLYDMLAGKRGSPHGAEESGTNLPLSCFLSSSILRSSSRVFPSAGRPAGRCTEPAV